MYVLKGSKEALTVLIVTHVTQVERVERGKAIYLKAFHLVGLAVHHQSVRGGSFVNFLGLVKLQG